MTIAEYMNPDLFVLTSQPGLNLDSQMEIDALNYDEYEKDRRAHVQMDDRQRAVGRELEAKHAARGSVLRQSQTGRGVGYDPNSRPGNPQMLGGAPLG